jgi:hypothetical protein
VQQVNRGLYVPEPPTSTFVSEKRKIFEIYPLLDTHDESYIKTVIQGMRNNRRLFNQEKDRRYKYFEFKYKRPKIFDTIDIDKLSEAVTKDVRKDSRHF